MWFFAFAWLLLAGTSNAGTNVEELHRAARAGDLKQVQSLIASGTPVNARDSLGGTALHDAAWAGEAEVVEYLIRSGADVNARHSEGQSTPLDYAVLMNRFEVVGVLLAHGAEANRPGLTPLHLAARRGETRIAQLLIAHGANVNARDEGGATPIEEAAWRGETAMVALLVEKGGDVKTANPQNGVTPLHAAAVKGHTDVARVLLKAGAQNRRAGQGRRDGARRRAALPAGADGGSADRKGREAGDAARAA